MAIHNEQTLQNIYNCEVAANLLRTLVVTQSQPSAIAQITTLILTATALFGTLTTTSNWSNLP